MTFNLEWNDILLEGHVFHLKCKNFKEKYFIWVKWRDSCQEVYGLTNKGYYKKIQIKDHTTLFFIKKRKRKRKGLEFSLSRILIRDGHLFNPFVPDPIPAPRGLVIWRFIWGLGRIWGLFLKIFGDLVGGGDNRHIPATNLPKIRSPFASRPPKIYVHILVLLNYYIF